MRYYARVALGLFAGLATVGGLWPFAPWWIGAVAGSLVAALAFLGTFFLWSADRPDEGYEQVLFDGRNNLHTVALIAFLTVAAYGGGLVALAPALPPEVAQMAAHQAELDDLAGAYQADADAYTRSELGDGAFREKLVAHAAEVERVTAAIGALAVGEAYAAMHEALGAQTRYLGSAVSAHQACLDQGTGRCLDAQLAIADRNEARAAYHDAAAAAGVS